MQLAPLVLRAALRALLVCRALLASQVQLVLLVPGQLGLLAWRALLVLLVLQAPRAPQVLGLLVPLA